MSVSFQKTPKLLTVNLEADKSTKQQVFHATLLITSNTPGADAKIISLKYTTNQENAATDTEDLRQTARDIFEQSPFFEDCMRTAAEIAESTGVYKKDSKPVVLLTGDHDGFGEGGVGEKVHLSENTWKKVDKLARVLDKSVRLNKKDIGKSKLVEQISEELDGSKPFDEGGMSQMLDNYLEHEKEALLAPTKNLQKTLRALKTFNRRVLPDRFKSSVQDSLKTELAEKLMGELRDVPYKKKTNTNKPWYKLGFIGRKESEKYPIIKAVQKGDKEDLKNHIAKQGELERTLQFLEGQKKPHTAQLSRAICQIRRYREILKNMEEEVSEDRFKAKVEEHCGEDLKKLAQSMKDSFSEIAQTKAKEYAKDFSKELDKAFPRESEGEAENTRKQRQAILAYSGKEEEEPFFKECKDAFDTEQASNRHAGLALYSDLFDTLEESASTLPAGYDFVVDKGAGSVEEGGIVSYPDANGHRVSFDAHNKKATFQFEKHALEELRKSWKKESAEKLTLEASELKAKIDNLNARLSTASTDGLPVSAEDGKLVSELYKLGNEWNSLSTRMKHIPEYDGSDDSFPEIGYDKADAARKALEEPFRQAKEHLRAIVDKGSASAKNALNFYWEAKGAAASDDQLREVLLEKVLEGHLLDAQDALSVPPDQVGIGELQRSNKAMDARLFIKDMIAYTKSKAAGGEDPAHMEALRTAIDACEEKFNKKVQGAFGERFQAQVQNFLGRHADTQREVFFGEFRADPKSLDAYPENPQGVVPQYYKHMQQAVKDYLSQEKDSSSIIGPEQLKEEDLEEFVVDQTLQFSLASPVSIDGTLQRLAQNHLLYGQALSHSNQLLEDLGMDHFDANEDFKFSQKTLQDPRSGLTLKAVDDSFELTPIGRTIKDSLIDEWIEIAKERTAGTLSVGKITPEGLIAQANGLLRKKSSWAQQDHSEAKDCVTLCGAAIQGAFGGGVFPDGIDTGDTEFDTHNRGDLKPLAQAGRDLRESCEEFERSPPTSPPHSTASPLAFTTASSGSYLDPDPASPSARSEPAVRKRPRDLTSEGGDSPRSAATT